MSVEYFLFIKEKHESISAYLNEIIKMYDECIQYVENSEETFFYDKEENVQTFQDLKTRYISHLEKTQNFCKTFNQISHKICNHQFVTDLIDISPDRSQTIEYCSICGYTKE
jgi:hypothetical protein